jgi:26S proteasome non-ATPase regulatory subunit 9
MGFAIPSPMNPSVDVRTLMSRKDAIEVELDSQVSILKANSSTLRSPLVDLDGFPRDDIDVYAVRGARVRIIELRNDLKSVLDEIGKVLEVVYDPALAVPEPAAQPGSTDAELLPFARVDGVVPGSPAATAVRAVNNYAILQALNRLLIGSTKTRSCC